MISAYDLTGQYPRILNMDLLLTSLKSQVSTLNILLSLGVAGFLVHKFHKPRVAFILYITTFLFFLLTSTSYLPRYLVNHIESAYPPFSYTDFPDKDSKVFIQVLGGGYTVDSRLPSTSQLSLVSLGRLAEGIRIGRLFREGTLVFSGDVSSGKESLASVTRHAAISLGVDSLSIDILDQPGTTREEAHFFKQRYGTQVKVIVVTDAIHMPRAMRFFREVGIKAYAAPTNYLIRHDEDAYLFAWWPSIGNFLLMDRVLYEFFATIKGGFFP